MECEVKWLNDGMSLIAETGSGHLLNMDGSKEIGGQDLAPRPMELMLAGAGGCTTFDVVTILKRGRHAIEACHVKLTATRAATDPKVFTHIQFHYLVSGKNLDPSAVERAIKLSSEKYCSASIMLGKTAKIEHTWEIINV